MKFLVILAAILVANTALAAPTADVQTRIFSYFLDRAEKGDASAQFIVGFRYESGSGTERDMKKAMYWYTKAASQGHEQARERVGEPASQPAVPATIAAPAPVAQAAVRPAPAAHKEVAKAEINKTPEETKPKGKAKAVTKPLPLASSATPTAVKRPEIARATASAAPANPQPRPSPVLVPVESQQKPAMPVPAANEPVASTVGTAAAVSAEVPVQTVPEKKAQDVPPINTLEVVLGGKWARNEVAPDYLPSSNTSCLRSGSEKITCFSGGAQAHVDGNAVMYAVKSTLSDFAPDGAFRVQYVFNVTDVSADTGTAGPDARDLYGLASRLGWQEPGLTLDCSVNDAGRISCLRNGRQQLTFYRK